MNIHNDTPITALRQRMIEDMTGREFFDVAAIDPSKKYLEEYIKRKSYLELCKKNENKRTERHKIIYFLME